MAASASRPQPGGATPVAVLRGILQHPEFAGIQGGWGEPHPADLKLVAAEGMNLDFRALPQPQQQLVQVIAGDAQAIEGDQDIPGCEPGYQGRTAREDMSNLGLAAIGPQAQAQGRRHQGSAVSACQTAEILA
jgi:hypothetical protein